MLPIKNIYLDSRFRTSDSKSNADFKRDLGTSYYMPNNTSFFMDDVNISNTWYSIDPDFMLDMLIRILIIV